MDDHRQAPAPPKGWVSCSDAKGAGFRGGADSFKRRLKELRAGLLRDMQTAGFSEEDAATVIDHNLVGWKKHPHPGSRPTLYASPDAVVMLQEDERKEQPPITQEGWRSIGQLSKTHYVGDANVRGRMLTNLRTGLLRDMQAAGFSEEDATAIVDYNLVGHRRPARGPSALYASPDAIGMLEHDRSIRRRDDPGNDRLDDVEIDRPNSILKYYIRNDQLESLRTGLIQDITALGVPVAEATAIVDRNFHEKINRRYSARDRTTQSTAQSHR